MYLELDRMGDTAYGVRFITPAAAEHARDLLGLGLETDSRTEQAVSDAVDAAIGWIARRGYHCARRYGHYRPLVEVEYALRDLDDYGRLCGPWLAMDERDVPPTIRAEAAAMADAATDAARRVAAEFLAATST